MHCLVTGGSGYIGQALLRVLAEREHLLTLLCRPGSTLKLQPQGTSLIDCDLGASDWDFSFADVDVVFHLAGIAHQQAGPAAYQAINVDACLALADRAIAAGVQRFVFLSSVKAALAEYDDAGMLLPVSQAKNPYAQSKALAEAGLQQRSQGTAMSLAIVRPALVYSSDALGHLRWLRRWSDLHLPAPPVGGERSLISRFDLINLLTRLVDLPLEAQTLMTVTDGERYSTRRLHAALCASTGKQPWMPSPPAFLWKVLSQILDVLRGEQRGSTWQRMMGDECYSPTDLEAQGFRPSLTFESSLEIS